MIKTILVFAGCNMVTVIIGSMIAYSIVYFGTGEWLDPLDWVSYFGVTFWVVIFPLCGINMTLVDKYRYRNGSGNIR